MVNIIQQRSPDDSVLGALKERYDAVVQVPTVIASVLAGTHTFLIFESMIQTLMHQFFLRVSFIW